MFEVKVGCCGFPVAREKYFADFDLVEIQSTFYKLPRANTVQRWRSEAPLGFEYAVKAWQAITHRPSSPTWRRSGLKVKGKSVKQYGSLKPTEENFKAWRLTLDVCRGLEAQTCIVQCPPSFEPSSENLANLAAFFKKIDRDKLLIGWEPRGSWNQQPDLISRLCQELDLIHVVDILRMYPALERPTAYIRLHGLGRREQNYGYRYSDSDLALLSQRLSDLKPEGVKRAYILFNNVSMFDDALRFKRLLMKSGVP